MCEAQDFLSMAVLGLSFLPGCFFFSLLKGNCPSVVWMWFRLQESDTGSSERLVPFVFLIAFVNILLTPLLDYFLDVPTNFRILGIFVLAVRSLFKGDRFLPSFFFFALGITTVCFKTET